MLDEIRPPFHFHIVLVEPEIPPNTGNAGRLCVATRSTLHLVGKLGFSIDDKQVRRAGLDYWKYVDLVVHDTFEDWLAWHVENTNNAPFYLVEENARNHFYGLKIPHEAAFVFGKETKGLSQELLEKYEDRSYFLPMFSTKIRSLNLSNAISIALFEGIRQQLSVRGTSK